MFDLTPTELERYSRQIQLPRFGEAAQRKLKSTTALVTGVGGLGGTAALYLAAAGIGRLILVRGGELRLDDMNRQILMTHETVGKPRVFQAKETLEKINPDVQVEAVYDYVTADNVDALVQISDIALDCPHNFEERDLLNAACVRWGKPMVEAAMNGMEAYLTTVFPGETGCLSCLFPEKPDWDRRAFGVLGAVPGALACLTALEAIKVITDFEPPLRSQLLTMDLARLEFNKLHTYKDPDCPVCSDYPYGELRSKRAQQLRQWEVASFTSQLSSVPAAIR